MTASPGLAGGQVDEAQVDLRQNLLFLECTVTGLARSEYEARAAAADKK